MYTYNLRTTYIHTYIPMCKKIISKMLRAFSCFPSTYIHKYQYRNRINKKKIGCDYSRGRVKAKRVSYTYPILQDPFLHMLRYVFLILFKFFSLRIDEFCYGELLYNLYDTAKSYYDSKISGERSIIQFQQCYLYNVFSTHLTNVDTVQ